MKFESAVSKAMEEFGYGQIISREWLEENLDARMPAEGTVKEITRAQCAFNRAITLFFRTLLLELNWYVKPLGDGEWLVVESTDQTKEALDALARTQDAGMRRAKTIISNTDVARLTESQKRERVAGLQKVASFEAFLARTLPLPAGLRPDASEQEFFIQGDDVELQ